MGKGALHPQVSTLPQNRGLGDPQKKSRSLSYRSAGEATNTVNEKVSAGASMEKAKLEVLLEEHHAAAYTWALHCCHGNQDESKDFLQTFFLTSL